ncbi:DUF2505 family protein [Corynebacterium neomassiliense]|uniref:DUF2505 family protein n=1 Tax=Corynebacterium neomassiliense TaxID=2079482 RepID=UPI0010307F66|nr:DUF2505 family protein [Corynebacterium neomassiliense]
MVTRATTVTRTIDLPLETVRRVVESEEFLLTVGDGPGQTVTLTGGERELLDDGSVTATVTATFGQGEDAVVMVQRAELSAPDEDGSFTLFTSVPLPGNLGTMATNQVFEEAEGDPGDVTSLVTTVAVQVDVPVIGPKLVDRVLSGAEQSTDQGVERILRLAS